MEEAHSLSRRQEILVRTPTIMATRTLNTDITTINITKKTKRSLSPCLGNQRRRMRNPPSKVLYAYFDCYPVRHVISSAGCWSLTRANVLTWMRFFKTHGSKTVWSAGRKKMGSLLRRRITPITYNPVMLGSNRPMDGRMSKVSSFSRLQCWDGVEAVVRRLSTDRGQVTLLALCGTCNWQQKRPIHEQQVDSVTLHGVVGVESYCTWRLILLTETSLSLLPLTNRVQQSTELSPWPPLFS